MIEMLLADLDRALTSNKLITVLMKDIKLSLVGCLLSRQLLRYGFMSRREYRQAIIAFWKKGPQAFCLMDPTKFP
jgi:hypothetical protein